MAGESRRRSDQVEPQQLPRVTPEDLEPARRTIWDLLCRTAVAACKGEDRPRNEHEAPVTAEDAAEAMGYCRPLPRRGDNEALADRIRRERAAAAQRLELEVYDATGHQMAMSLRGDYIDRCSDDHAMSCPLRDDHACPRNLRDLERKNLRHKVHEATLRGVPREIAEMCGDGKLPLTMTLREVKRFCQDGRRLLLLCNDQGGEGTQAAGWAVFERHTGRFVFAHELRFLRRDNPIVQTLMAQVFMVLDNLHDLPKSALELVETLLEQAIREKGRKILLVSRAPAAEFLDQFSTRTQELFASHNAIHAVSPEQGKLL